MRLFAAACVATACVLETCVVSASVCSSLSGPFCTGVSSDFATPPAHATASLDKDEQQIREDELNKRLKIESVLKEYELEAAKQPTVSEEDRLLEELSELLDETAALLAELEEDGKESPVIGSFAFSSEGDTYELLETMDGKELKDFFELAYDEVLRSWETNLEDMSLEISQGLRNSVEELKQLKDYELYDFKHMDEAAFTAMRQRFENHRLIEVQRTFERLIIAKNQHERQLAYEAVIFLFQLAEEQAEDEEDLAAFSATNEAGSDSGDDSLDNDAETGKEAAR